MHNGHKMVVVGLCITQALTTDMTNMDAISLIRLHLTLPYLTFGVGGYWPPSAEAITGLAQCASPK